MEIRMDIHLLLSDISPDTYQMLSREVKSLYGSLKGYVKARNYIVIKYGGQYVNSDSICGNNNTYNI